MVEKKRKIKKYCTDGITNILCNFYNLKIDDKKAVKLLNKFRKEDLADYIFDSFNRDSLSAASISIIPEEK